MIPHEEVEKIHELVTKAAKIVVIQADNPDSDSLGSALALEHILGDMGKDVILYCGVDIPSYLRYFSGWDRVQKELPKDFDISIVVDASTLTLFEKLLESGQKGWLATKPCIVIDHHEIVENRIDFASVTLNDSLRASAGELIYLISKQLGWQVSVPAQTMLMNSILGDTQGLTNQLASSETYRIMAEFIEAGVSRVKVEEKRRLFNKMHLDIFRYKADLIKRTEFATNNQIALVIIPQEEINTYSPLYNPAPLIQNDIIQVEGVRVAIVIKSYTNGRVTGAIRTNIDAPIASLLAEFLGGGGHAHASGFKVTDGRSAKVIRDQCIAKATELLKELDEAV